MRRGGRNRDVCQSPCPGRDKGVKASLLIAPFKMHTREQASGDGREGWEDQEEALITVLLTGSTWISMVICFSV